MKTNILLEIIYNATFASLIATKFIQMLKEKLNITNLYLYFIIEFLIGILFSLYFTELDFIGCIWVGFIVIIGADSLYESLKGKLGLESKKANLT